MAKLGSKERPYDYEDYYNMANHSGSNSWTGGWVRWADTLKLVYVTAQQDVERDNDDGTLGSEENPFSREAYNEMYAKKTWPGGFVSMVANEEPVYMDRNDREDSACGCGSGSGNGCGGNYLMPGQEWVTDIVVNVVGEFGVPELLICWGEGSFDSSGYPYVSAGLTFNGRSSEKVVALNAWWDNPFVVKIQDGRLTDIVIYNIPPQYRR